jgi:hypothetical protein
MKSSLLASFNGKAWRQANRVAEMFDAAAISSLGLLSFSVMRDEATFKLLALCKRFVGRRPSRERTAFS